MNNISKIENYTKMRLDGNKNGHGYDHAQRVCANVRKICKVIDCDLDICIIAAYVHDLIDRKVVDDVELATRELQEFLQLELALPKSKVSHVITICQSISYSKGLELNSVEAKVVQDADRLDALGAVGIARTIAYAVDAGNPIYVKDDHSDGSAIGHFHSKLYKLKDLMNFDISKQYAEEKMQIMYEFENQFINFDM